MPLRVNELISEHALGFLRHCYDFANNEWPHTIREDLPDKGFEKRFRESCIIKLQTWRISQEREMQLGCGLDTLSGVYHEVDIVAQHQDMIAILEIKNRQGHPPGKNDVIVFFAKILDYLALNPSLLLKDVCPALMSNAQFETSGLAACLGLGIHPIAPGLRPLPMLINNAQRMSLELERGVNIGNDLRDKYEDFCAQLNSMNSTLSETWLSNRCGYRSENTIVLRAVGGIETQTLSQELRELNVDCNFLIEAFQKARAESKREDFKL